MTTDSTHSPAEPLPCPFCGAEPRQRRVQDESLYSHATVTYLQIVCDECDAQSLSSEDHDDVIARWNRRATPAAAETAQPAAPEPIAEWPAVKEARKAATAQMQFYEEMMQPATQAQPVAPEPELLQALEAASEWISGAPHGDDCFVSDHYPGDPGNRCNCGKDSIEEYLDGVIERATQAQPATHAEVLTDAWCDRLTAEAMLTVDDPLVWGRLGSSNGDMLRQLGRSIARAAIATQAAQQPKDLGDAATRPGLSAGAPIPIAACGGWVRMEDAAPPPDTDCVVWVRYSPGPGHFSIDRWEMQREDPIGMGGPTIETGHGWSDNFESDVVYWLALAPVPDAEYDPREGSLVAEGDGDEGSTLQGQEPGPKDAP